MAEAPDPVAQAAAKAGLSEQDVMRTDIEQTRAELAETVDALSRKLDVKARLAPHRTQIAIGAGVAAAAVVLIVVVRKLRSER
jgi:2C-methyl-D-erythritol 2,4-cyclodiphosphate synthase